MTTNPIAEVIPQGEVALNCRLSIENVIRRLKAEGYQRRECKSLAYTAIRSHGSGTPRDTRFTWEIYAFVDQLYS